MNRVDRQNLAAINSNLQHGEPIGIDTATGIATTTSMTENTTANIAAVPDSGFDATVSNGGNITPKPGTKYAAPEEDDWGLSPIGTQADSNDATVPNAAQEGSVLTPKPGTKYAAPDDFGAIGVDANGNLIDSSEDTTVPNTNGQGSVLTPKPGTKYAAPEEGDTAPAGVADLGCTVSDIGTYETVPNGEVVTPKPGTKYAC